MSESRRIERGGRPDLVTFDCYGTLIDWRNGIADAFDEAVPGARHIPRDRLFGAYAEAEAMVERGPYRPYRQVLEAAASGAATRLGLRVPSARRSFLAEALPSWRPFPDTSPALERLAGLGLRLGILSNIDDDLLARTLQHFTVSFSPLITAERLRSYKPAPGHFNRALQVCGGLANRIVHIAESSFHDIQPARQLGIRAIWVNRTGAPPAGELRPSAEVGDLAAAAAWVARLSAATPSDPS